MTNRLSTAAQAALNRTAPARNGKPKAVGKANRFAPLNNTVDLHLPGMSDAEVRVYVVLFRHVDSRTNTVAMSHNQIAEASGCHRTTVIRAIKALTDRKLVKRIAKGSTTKLTPNRYILTTCT